MGRAHLFTSERWQRGHPTHAGEDTGPQRAWPGRKSPQKGPVWLGHAGLAKDGLGLSPTGGVVGTSVPWLGPRLPAGSWNWRGHRMGGA